MMKLVRLEWKKNHIRKYMLGAVITAAALCLFAYALSFWGIANDPDGTLDAVAGKDTVSSVVELFSGMAYLIFASVMCASFVVSPYKNKTMNLMFVYPIKRQKILAAEMLSVWLFNFAALVLTKLAAYLCVYIGSGFMTSSFVVDFDMGSGFFYIQLVLKAVVIVSMSFLALFIGMAVKSSKACIVSSFLLIFLTQANVGDFTMAGSAVFPAVLTVISLAAAVLTVCRAEKKDLI